MVHAAAPAGLSFSTFADNLPNSYFGLPASLEEGFSLLSKLSPAGGTSTVQAFMTTFSQTVSPILLSFWPAFGGKTQERKVGTFSRAG